MKHILCYGDSNMWGYNPANGERYPIHLTWPSLLSARLGENFHVVTEGLPGRTTTCDDPLEPHRNGLTCLTPCLMSHRPLDLVIVMLGTNNLKARFHQSAADISGSMRLH